MSADDGHKDTGRSSKPLPAQTPSNFVESGGRSGGLEPERSRFESPKDVKEELLGAYNDWSSMLTGRSVATALGAIGATWTVHGSTTAIHDNFFALMSVVVAIAFLGFDLLATWFMAGKILAVLNDADTKHEEWMARYDARLEDPHFPYTSTIDGLALVMRLAKAFAPAVAVASFLVSVFLL